MALNAGTVWEIRTSGNSYNGGGYYDRGGASTDYSQQDGSELCKTDFATDVAGTELSTVGNNFTAAMVGNIVQLWTAGPGALIGFFEIIAFIDTGHVTLDRSAGSGLSNLYGNVGGAVADLERIDNVIVASNTVHIKAGTYTLSGNILTTAGIGANFVKIRGYNASRGDNPTSDSRPLFSAGTYIVGFGGYTLIENMRTTHNATTSYFQTGTGCHLRNVKIQNVYANANAIALYTGAIGNVIVDCDIQCDSGYAIRYLWTAALIASHIHDSNVGIRTNAGNNHVIDCIIEGNTLYGFQIDNVDHNNCIMNCTISGNGTGIYADGTINYTTILNNQITNNTTGLDSTADPLPNAYIDYNNWHGNTADIGNTTPKGPHATANDPGYANPGSDFSDVDDANAFGIRLGVG